MSEGSYLLEASRTILLAAGFAYAAARDLASREVSDHLWQILGVAGVLAGVVGLAGAGALPLVLWVVVGAFALQHLFPWDDALGERHAGKAGGIEVGLYAAVLAAVVASAVRWGIGRTDVPVIVVAALVSVVVARVLFEAGVLYGGADAKALIVVGVLVPVFGAPLVYAPAAPARILGLLPFSLTLLTNAALLSIVVPIVIAVRNVARGEFSLGRGFTSYTLDVDELPHRFVWVRDPALGEDTLANDAETSAEDTRRRSEIAEELRRRGVRRVWVTPQLPFLVVMAAGAFAGLLAGNLLLDLFVRI